MFFLAAVGAPDLRRVEDPGLRSRLSREVGLGVRRTGWAAIAVLLATGILNLHFRGLLTREVWGGPDFRLTPYGRLLGAKIVLVLTMLALPSLHDFLLGPRAPRSPPGSPAALRFRRASSWIARINALLGVVLVYVAVRLVRG